MRSFHPFHVMFFFLDSYYLHRGTSTSFLDLVLYSWGRQTVFKYSFSYYLQKYKNFQWKLKGFEVFGFSFCLRLFFYYVDSRCFRCVVLVLFLLFLPDRILIITYIPASSISSTKWGHIPFNIQNKCWACSTSQHLNYHKMFISSSINLFKVTPKTCDAVH